MSRRLTLLDPLQLRSTSVYASPRDISILKVIFGDFRGSNIPCTSIDKDGYLHHISDRPMELITAVYVDGEPKTSGYKALTAYQDETGHSIACIIFDEPQYEKQISVSGKGSIDLETGYLIENPADFIRALLLDIQGYDADSIDTGEIARFYADCLKEDIQIACVLDEVVTLKSVLDELGQNLHAHWLLSDGKSIMRLRDTVSGAPSKYAFSEDNISGFSITAEPLLNEITINYAYDFLNRKYQASLTKHNPLSKRIYDDAKSTYDIRMIQTTRQAERVADAVLKTYSIPQIICSFVHNARSIYIEPGDIATVSHLAGPAVGGYDAARGLVVQKNYIEHSYKVAMEQSGTLYSSELLSLTQVASSGAAGITIAYDKGVATITIYADVLGSPPVEGAEVTISGVRKLTDKKGQVRFNLLPGRYTAFIKASGYEDAEITFSV